MTPLQKDIAFLIALNEDKPSTRPPHLISEYNEGRRVMPPDAPLPGPVELWRSHYAIEIMDCFSPYNSTRWTDFMSAAQVVKSFIAECVIGYSMGANPSPILFVSGTDDLLLKWGKRLEPLIDSLGLREKMRAPVENKKSRKGGDTGKQKLFTGGFLEMGSAQSPASIAADSIKILIMDEVDRAPKLLSTGEGRWDMVAEARTKAWESRKKIGAFSTPKLYDNSIIYARFLLGDQCQYLVPCPLCGKLQLLLSIQDTEKSVHGLKAEYKAGNLEYVYYICDHCHDAIFEHHKNSMIPAGKWEPMATPMKFRRSFQINSLYSPVGAYSWLSYYMDYLAALEDPEGMRSFTNLQDGMPYREKGAKPKRENVITLRGTYKSETVPDHILFLTMAVDVQRGSNKEEKKNPQRLEIEVLGHSSKYRTASICKKIFKGTIKDAYDGAWEALNDWAMKNHLTFKRRDGREFQCKVVFVDSGDGKYSDVVYNFCARWKNTYPIKGFQALTKRKNEREDEMTKDNFKRYRPTKISDSITLITISTNHYKKHIYNCLNMSIKAIQDGDTENRAGFYDFPKDYKDKYFDSLTAEELRRDGTFYHPQHKPNEDLDLKVYNVCAGDFYLDDQVKKYRDWARDKKWAPHKIDAIDTKFVLRDLEAEVLVKKVVDIM